MIQRTLASAPALTALCLLLVADGSLKPPARDLVGPLLARVPQASAVLAFAGRGFPDAAPLGQSDTAPAPDQRPGRAVDVRLPDATSGAFLIGSAGGRSRIPVKLGSAHAAALDIEAGRGVYRSVYEGVDVVAVRDPDYFELSFVVHDPTSAPALAFQVGSAEAGEQVSVEEGSGVAIVRSAAGTPLLQIEPPVAFDAAGVQRTGHYELAGSQLSIALKLSDLTPPIVVDPRFAIPFWTLLSDERAPGAVTYDKVSGSREIRLSFDEARGRPVLIRPVRSQQREDSTTAFGKLSTHQMYGQFISSRLRDAPDGSLNVGEQERADWRRSYSVQSETWEWNGSGWERRPIEGLIGMIDPALSYDRGRQRLVAMTGATPDVYCSNDFLTVGISGVTHCKLTQYDSTYELAPDGWKQLSIVSPPPPRVRASSAPFPPHQILFGGRALEPPPGFIAVEPYGRPYPDSMTRGLLNDTWRYDGERWEHVPTANAPSARESAPLVFDERRHRLVLVGGGDAGFDVWEFDGSDWVERVPANSATLPISLRGRKKMLAAWNPARQTTLLFGGIAAKLESCALDDATLTIQRRDPLRQEALGQAGCLGGYMHDSWEWDGQSLRQLTQTAYAGRLRGMPVFRQIRSDVSWFEPSTPAQAEPQNSGRPALLPWRYDADPNHFRLRSTLERAHAASNPAPTKTTVAAGAPAPLSPPPAGTPNFASPMFASDAQPDMVLDPVHGKAVLVNSDDARVFETTGSTWTERTPTTSPFASGMQDFFAVTWDSAAQRMVLFDPRTAETWTHGDTGGWLRLNPSASPPVWSVDPEIRRERDVTALTRDGSDTNKFADVALRMPQMTFDRARSRTVMLYAGALWEFAGNAWQKYSAPPGWQSCQAAPLLAYDGLRSRVVAVGCQLPGTTMEWDGSTWRGPFPGPYSALALRQTDYGRDVTGYRVIGDAWKGTLQTSWEHPNALFESRLLGGVSTFDAGGRLLTWDGSSWRVGPPLPEGSRCDWSTISGSLYDMVPPYNIRHDYTLRDFLPMCFFPPAIEDAANNRILVFRDGDRALRELRLGEPTPSWGPVKVGDSFSDGTRVYPHPFELLSAEHVTLQTITDPQSIQLLALKNELYVPSNVPFALPRDKSRVPESLINNLFWPFRLLPDPVSKRVRILTHRGAVWELGAELRTGLGDACANTADCGEGFCSPEGICCNSSCTGTCLTCGANHPGRCEAVAAGAPEPLARCGQGECGGVCSGPTPPAGVAKNSCAFDVSRSCGPDATCVNGMLTHAGHCAANSPSCVTQDRTPVACAGGLQCADPVSCKAACSSRLDCTSPYAECNAENGACQPDAVSVAANGRGVQPSSWVPQAHRNPAQLAALMKSLGLPSDAQGKVFLDSLALGGVIPTYDPELKTPITGFYACIDRLQACEAEGQALDACVAAAPRCVSSTPWDNDPAGFDCCPSECLLDYFQQRDTQRAGRALTGVLNSFCYPGVKTYLEGLR